MARIPLIGRLHLSELFVLVATVAMAILGAAGLVYGRVELGGAGPRGTWEGDVQRLVSSLAMAGGSVSLILGVVGFVVAVRQVRKRLRGGARDLPGGG